MKGLAFLVFASIVLSGCSSSSDDKGANIPGDQAAAPSKGESVNTSGPPPGASDAPQATQGGRGLNPNFDKSGVKQAGTH